MRIFLVYSKIILKIMHLRQNDVTFCELSLAPPTSEEHVY